MQNISQQSFFWLVRYYKQNNLTVMLNVSRTEKFNSLTYWQESDGSTRHKMMLIHNELHMILNTNDPEQLHYMYCNILLLSTRLYIFHAISSPPLLLQLEHLHHPKALK